MGVQSKGGGAKSSPGRRAGGRGRGGGGGGRGDFSARNGGRGFAGRTGGNVAASMNPFDAVANRKSKFWVLNKRAKGQVRNVGKARQMAVERRKKTLLVEYNASKKVNVFKDRRFGEDDPSLSLEEKMLLRFQKERQKRARKSSAGRFNLEQDDDADDDDNYGGLRLTHKGKALGGDGEDDYQDKDGLVSSDDEDGSHGLNKQIVKELHFGGSGPGDRKRPSPADEEGHYGPGAAKKTRAELMEEIIAKSKMHKATKAKQKDEQEMVFSHLDEEFQDLLGDLDFRDKYKSKRDEKAREAREKQDKKAVESSALLLDEGKDYDELMSAIKDERFAAKAKDRTKTPEEIATEEKEKLKRLEAARLARMQGEVDAELKREARGGQGEGDGEDDGEDGGSSSEGEGSDGSLGKLGQGWDADSDNEEEEEEEEDEEEEEEGDSDYDDSPSSSTGDEEEEEARDEESGSREEEVEEGEESGSSSEEGEEGTKEISPALLYRLLALKEKEEKSKKKASQEQAAEECRPVGKTARQKAAVAKVVAQTQEGSTGINPQMPYILECPSTMEKFVDMVREYAQDPKDVAEMITRIRQYHAIRSGGDKARVHNFYDILMRRLACLGDALVPAHVVEVDAISEALAAMTPEMAAVAAALWGRMLTGLQAKLGKALRDHELGQRARSTWPSPGALLLLRLLPRIFPATDFRHPVVTPALLYMGQALSQCPILTPTDIERGLFVAALAVQYTEEAGRLMPEVHAFVLSLLGAMAGTDHAQGLPTLAPSLAADLHRHTVNDTGAAAGRGGEDETIAPIVLGRGKHLKEEEEEHQEEGKKGDQTEAITVALARQYLSAACQLLRRLAAGPLKQSPAARELFEPFLACLATLESIVANATKKSKKEGLSIVLGQLRETRAKVVGVVEEALKVRKVLSWRKKSVTAIQSLAPRVIDNFVVRKDEGLEREAARVKQLTRQVKREKKGVMRELRRDAAFLDSEKVRVEREKEEARKQVIKDNTSWFEASAADFNKQVKMAKGETLRGGGSGLKRDILGKGKRK
ncbi:hypothetical protein VYU27_003012 [Nannochloropsis oceanica]